MRRHRDQRIHRRVAIGVVVVILVGIGVVVLRNQPGFRRFPKRFEAVAENVLYRSSQPNVRQIGNLVEAHGVRTLLIVREGSSHRVPDEIECAAEHGINLVKIPIESRKQIPDDFVEAFFRCVDEPRNQPVLVHCSAGRHRTGYLCALYRIERQGWTVERAVEEMLSFGFDIESQGALLEALRKYTPGRFGGKMGPPVAMEDHPLGTAP